MIRFTVITITYNAEQVLERTLQSVLHQTYEGVEHLIIDGASKDGTLAMAEAYKQQSDASDSGHKVIIKSEPDHGIYDAMNKGLTQAYGDYMAFPPVEERGKHHGHYILEPDIPYKEFLEKDCKA